MTKNIIVTGGTGFVGSWMRRKQPDNVEAVYFNRHGHQNLDLVTSKYDYVVHLAPVAPDKVIAFAQKNKARLLYCSSGIVYHPENDTKYRQNKIKWEQQCLDSGVDVVIARLFTFFGDGLDDNKAITEFFTSAKQGQPLNVYGDGLTVRSYMHGRDLGRAMWQILFDGETGRAYDVGSTRPVTIKRLAERVAFFMRLKINYANQSSPVKLYLPTEERLWKPSQK
jgi:nucleoside-diphosphate-sugar epimerase